MGWRHVIVVLSAVVIAGVAPAPAQFCTGDCDDDGLNTVDELIVGLRMALGELSVASCPAFDADADLTIGIDDVVRATATSLGECPPAPRGARAAGTLGVVVGTAAATHGDVVSVAVRLDSGGLDVAGVQNDLAFPPQSPIAAIDGRPDCEVNPAIDRPQTAFAFHPAGCTPGADCTAIRAIVISFSNLDPIADGAVLYTCRLAVSALTPFGDHPLENFNALGASPSGEALPSEAVSGMLQVTAPTGCGDGLDQGEEQCDDGNRVGGDGCAANCSIETRRVFNLSSDRSRIIIQTESLPIVFSVQGAIALDVGEPRPSDPTGSVPLASALGGLSIDPIRITGLVCACVRAIEEPRFGPGLWAQGAVGCGAGDVPAVDRRIIRDHNTSPGSAGNWTSATPDDPQCDDESTLMPGLTSSACLEGTGSACGGENSLHVGVCNGPAVLSLGELGDRGSAAIQARVAIGLLSDAGSCRTDRPQRNGRCLYEDYGPDCLPCTDDDLEQGIPEHLFLTTGGAEAALSDVNNSGAVIAADRDCFGAQCLASVAGAPFDCDGLFGSGTFATAELAAAFTSIDQRQIGDNVTTVLLAGVNGPPVTIAPTSTRTPTPTPTRTAPTSSATPTPTGRVDMPGSLIVSRLRVRADTAGRAGVDNGNLRVSAIVNTNAPFGGLIEAMRGDGLTLRLRLGGGVQVAVDWQGADCDERATARGPQFTCSRHTAGVRRRLRLRPIAAPNVYALEADARGLSLAPPLLAAPVVVEALSATARRADSIAECESRGGGAQVVACRERGAGGS